MHGLALVILYPALRTPLIADDFLNPFDQFNQSGPGLWNNLRDAWTIVFSGASFRPVGGPVGALFNWSLLQLDAHLGWSVSTTYAVSKALVFSFLIVSGSLFIFRLGRLLNLNLEFTNIHFSFAIVFASSIQIHGSWSNDPVVSYPLAGFFSTALAFVFLSSLFGVIRQPNFRTAGVSALLAILAIANYELSFGAVLGGSVFILLYTIVASGSKAFRRRTLLYGQFPLLASLIFVVLGRLVIGSASSTYAGTTLRLGDQFPLSLVRAVVSALPTSAWVLSRDVLGGSVAISAKGLLVVFTILTISCLPFSIKIRSSRNSPIGRLNRLNLGAAALMLITYWISAAGLQAMTIKVQDETPRIGYVYTHYAVGFTVVAVYLTLGLLLFPWSRISRTAVTSIFAALAVFCTVQLSINWRLSELLSQTTVPNQNLLNAYSEKYGYGERCAALRDWSAGEWPTYYEERMVQGIQNAYWHFNKVDFCKAYVPNP